MMTLYGRLLLVVSCCVSMLPVIAYAESPIRLVQSTVFKEEKHLRSVLFSPNGKCVYVASGSPFKKGQLFVLDPETLQWQVRYSATLLSGISVNRAGDLMGAVDYLGLVTLYSPASGEVVHQFEQIHTAGTALLRAEFAPDGKTLITGGGDNLLVIWDIKTRKCRHAVQLSEPHYGCHYVFAITSKSDAGYARSEVEKIVKIDLETGKLLDHAKPKTKETDNHIIVGLALSPDDKTLALAFHDKDAVYKPAKPIHRSPVVLVDAKTLKPRLTLGSHPYGGANHLKFTADGKFLISAGSEDGYCCIWDMETNKLVASERVVAPIKGSRYFYDIDSMDVSPDGRRMVIVSSLNSTTALWDISSVTGAKKK